MKNIHYIIIALLLLVVSINTGLSGEGEENQKSVFLPSPIAVERSKMNFRLMSEAELTEIQTNQENNLTQHPDYKHRGKAFIRSLLLPGSGERYLGKKTLAKAFLITEVTLWVSYFAFREYGNWVRDDALAYAATHSGAGIDGKPSQYYVDIGNYSDIYEYNDAKQRMREFDKVYDTDDYFWEWDSDQNRREFENMRIAGDRAINRSVFVLGGIFANHLLSAIDAVWQTYRHNKELSQENEEQVKIQIQSDFKNGEISLHLKKLF